MHNAIKNYPTTHPFGSFEYKLILYNWLVLYVPLSLTDWISIMLTCTHNALQRSMKLPHIPFEAYPRVTDLFFVYFINWYSMKFCTFMHMKVLRIASINQSSKFVYWSLFEGRECPIWILIWEKFFYQIKTFRRNIKCNFLFSSEEEGKWWIWKCGKKVQKVAIFIQGVWLEGWKVSTAASACQNVDSYFNNSEKGRQWVRK